MSSPSRGYLPHLESSHRTYFVTFRLADGLSVSVLFTVEGLNINLGCTRLEGRNSFPCKSNFGTSRTFLAARIF
jgi:hypothetical protein